MTTTTNEATRLFIVTKDAHGEDRMFAGCVNFEATWTLQADKARSFSDFDLARSVASQFPEWRIVTGHPTLGPKVLCAPDHKIYIIGWAPK